MHFLESTSLYYKKPVMSVMSGCLAEPFTSDYSDLAGDKATTVRQVFEKKFIELADKLSRYALTADEIKIQRPQHHKEIQDAISEMDSAWSRFDYEGFLVACKQIEQFYFNALRGISEIKEKSVKINE